LHRHEDNEYETQISTDFSLTYHSRVQPCCENASAFDLAHKSFSLNTPNLFTFSPHLTSRLAAIDDSLDHHGEYE